MVAAVARTASRATSRKLTRFGGGVHASSWGVSMHQKGVSTYQLPIMTGVCANAEHID